MGLLNFNSVGSVNNSSTVPQSSNPAKGSKAINIDFPVTDMINMSAGMRYETDNADGSKTVVQYDGKGETYTEKTFFENKMTSYKKYSAFGNKLLKDADYDFVTGKMYQESEYFDDGRIDKHYDEDGFYSGKNEITFEKDGSTRVNRYDKDNNYLYFVSKLNY